MPDASCEGVACASGPVRALSFAVPARAEGPVRLGRDDAMIARSLLLAVAFAALDAVVLPAPELRAQPLALPDSVVLLPEVRVDTSRARTGVRVPPTAVVSELPMRAPGTTASSIGEVLTQAAGLRVLQYGGLGAYSTVSVRGAPASHTALLLDGEPLQGASHSVVSLSDLPAGAIEYIEVIRGAAPGIGAPGASGAINLVTLPAPGLADLRLVRGSFGTWEGRARTGLEFGPFAFGLNAGYQGARGDFEFHDDNGTPFNPDDDSTTTRTNNRYDAAHALASLAWTPRPGLVVRAREDWFRNAQGVPGLAAIQASNAHRSLERSVSRLDVARAASGAWPAWRAGGSLRRDRARFRDAGGELGLGRWHSEDRTASERATAGLGWPAVPGGFALRAAADATFERARTTNSADAWDDPPVSRRHGRGADVGVEFRPPGGRVRVTATQRWDRMRDALRAVSTTGVAGRIDVTRETRAPHAGIRVDVTRALALRANVSDATRLPDFSELFGDGGAVYGNVGLLPEHTRGWDAGASLAGGAGPLAGRVSWSHFDTRARDLIHFLPAGNRVRAQNLSRVRIHGDEVELAAGPVAGIRLSAAWTRQSSVDESPTGYWVGKELPALPGSQLEARLAWESARGGVRVNAFRLGANFLDRSNRQRVPARTLAGVALWWQRAATRVSAEVRNLGDARASDVAGYPLPGRSVYLALESRIPFTASRKERHP